MTYMLRRPQGDGYSFATGGTGGGFGGKGSGGGTGGRRSWCRWKRILWHGALVKESLLLQRFAVNSIDANKAADKIPILLIRKSAIA